jgi:virginiamycin B lyase
MRKLIGIVFVTFQLLGCSQVSTLRQSGAPISQFGRVRNHIVQSGDGSDWVTLYPPGPNMAEPFSVTPGPDGKMWFTQEDVHGIDSVVGSIDMSGVITEYPVSATPAQITTGSDGALWFDELYPGMIGRITTSGTLTEYQIPYTYSDPYGLCSGPDGNIWFADRSTYSVGKVTMQGIITQYKLPKPRRHDSPYGITSGPDGNVWFTVASGGNYIGRINPLGHITLFAIPTPNSDPIGIALDSNGRLYFTEASAGKIGEITPSGKITEFPLPSTDKSPEEISQGNSGGHMWFDDYDATTGNSQLRQFNIRTKSFGPAVVPPYITQQLFFMHNEPDGNMWVADASGAILIHLAYVLTSVPASIDISGVGQSQTIQVQETHFGGSFSAQSSDQNIATVSPGNQSNSFVVTAQGMGSCSVRVSDGLGNYIDVPVTVQ